MLKMLPDEPLKKIRGFGHLISKQFAAGPRQTKNQGVTP